MMTAITHLLAAHNATKSVPAVTKRQSSVCISIPRSQTRIPHPDYTPSPLPPPPPAISSASRRVRQMWQSPGTCRPTPGIFAGK